MKKNILLLLLLFSCSKKVNIPKEIYDNVYLKIPNDYSIEKCKVEPIIDDYVLTFELKFDSAAIISIGKQVRTSKYYSMDTNTTNNKWIKDQIGYSYSYYKFDDSGSLLINCYIDTLQNTLYYQYAED